MSEGPAESWDEAYRFVQHLDYYEIEEAELFAKFTDEYGDERFATVEAADAEVQHDPKRRVYALEVTVPSWGGPAIGDEAAELRIEEHRVFDGASMVTVRCDGLTDNGWTLVDGCRIEVAGVIEL